MSKQSEMDILWQEMRTLDAQLRTEGRECGKRGGLTEHYKNLRKKMLKAKAEYDKLGGGAAYNPMSLEDGERMTVKKVMGDVRRKTGPDTHHRLAD